ncbi:MAG: helix-turn-helix domain-containing protein, partial [Rhodospirillales bacterium]
MDQQIKPTDYVQSLERGLAVIKSFGTGRPEKTLTEVAGLTWLTRAGARRLLLTLQQLGHVRSDGKYYRLAPRVLDLGFAYLSAQPWWQSAEPFMEEVVASLGESCSAAVLDGDDI